MSTRLSDEDAERIAKSVERGVTRALSRFVAALLLGAVTIFIAPMLLFMGLGTTRSPVGWLGLSLAALTILAIVLAWYLVLRGARADRR
jgi:hypothetical protein